MFFIETGHDLCEIFALMCHAGDQFRTLGSQHTVPVDVLRGKEQG